VTEAASTTANSRSTGVTNNFAGNGTSRVAFQPAADGDQGVQDPDERLRCEHRPHDRRRDQRLHRERHERAPRRGALLGAQQRPGRANLLPKQERFEASCLSGPSPTERPPAARSSFRGSTTARTRDLLVTMRMKQTSGVRRSPAAAPSRPRLNAVAIFPRCSSSGVIIRSTIR